MPARGAYAWTPAFFWLRSGVAGGKSIGTKASSATCALLYCRVRGPLRYNRGPLAIRELIGRAVRRQKRQFGAWRLKLAFQPCATGPGINTEGNPQKHTNTRGARLCVYWWKKIRSQGGLRTFSVEASGMPTCQAGTPTPQHPPIRQNSTAR